MSNGSYGDLGIIPTIARLAGLGRLEVGIAPRWVIRVPVR
jgi:hypothetical protein